MSKVKSAQILPSRESNEDLAGEFSTFFMKKTEDLLSTDHTESCPVPTDTATCSSSFCHFLPRSADSIEGFINKSPGKTCMLDPIPTFLLKKCFKPILPFLQHLINTSLCSGVFPNCFKSALVLPLIKKPTLDPECLLNYRPISNLSFLSKVLERVVYSQLYGYLERNSLFAKMQSGYRAHHSVETALVRVYNDLLLAVDNKKEAVLVLLDLSSAFDTVNHTILLSRLSNRFGISGQQSVNGSDRISQIEPRL